MGYEVELKAHVADPERVRKILVKEGCVLQDEEKQDIYFSLPNDDPLFRIRYEKYGEGKGSVLFTTKEKSVRNGIEVNRETEFTTTGDQFKASVGFVLALGYVEYVRKLKRGIHTHLALDGNELHIELVEVPPLGWFVEMEFILEREEDVPKAKEGLHHALSLLGVGEEHIEPRYYMHLLREPPEI